jgi:hypothetical protein
MMPNDGRFATYRIDCGGISVFGSPDATTGDTMVKKVAKKRRGRPAKYLRQYPEPLPERPDKPYTPEYFERCLEKLNLDPYQFAAVMTYGPRSGEQWKADPPTMPTLVKILCDLMVHFGVDRPHDILKAAKRERRVAGG